jgi:DNA-binding response OmpR family regulator
MDGKHNSAQSVLVKPIGTQDLLRQIEALLVQHQDEKQSRARLAHYDAVSSQKQQKAG